MNKPVKIEQHSGLGMLWFIGWLFSIGFLKLSFGKVVLALLVWPYFLGAHLADNAAPGEEPAADERAEEEE